MFDNAVTRRLGIRYPIVGGTMMHITTPEFVAAIAEAGGLGVLASAIYRTPEEFSAALDRVRELTDKPFAVNINLFPMLQPNDNNVLVDIMAAKKVPIVETSGHHAPEDLAGKFKRAGMTWIHKCVGLRYALKVQELGVDMVTVVGYENGGATGKLDLGTIVLIPRVVESLKVPVIGGGGISDGRGFLAALALGAQGVIIGTRLLVTKEAPVHENLKQALVQADETETLLLLRSLNATHRTWANAAAKRALELEQKQAEFDEIMSVVAGVKAKKMYQEGDVDLGVVSCGQGVGLIHDIPTVQELFDRIIAEAETIAKRLAS